MFGRGNLGKYDHFQGRKEEQLNNYLESTMNSREKAISVPKPSGIEEKKKQQAPLERV